MLVEQLERKMLFMWSDGDCQVTRKVAPTLRQQYWRKIEDTYVASGGDRGAAQQ